MDSNEKVTISYTARPRQVTLLRASHITNTKLETIRKRLDIYGYYETEHYRVEKIQPTFDSSDHPDDESRRSTHRIAIVKKTK